MWQARSRRRAREVPLLRCERQRPPLGTVLLKTAKARFGGVLQGRFEAAFKAINALYK
jgi:hypothetical protein